MWHAHGLPASPVCCDPAAQGLHLRCRAPACGRGGQQHRRLCGHQHGGRQPQHCACVVARNTERWSPPSIAPPTLLCPSPRLAVACGGTRARCHNVTQVDALVLLNSAGPIDASFSMAQWQQDAAAKKAPPKWIVQVRSVLGPLHHAQALSMLHDDVACMCAHTRMCACRRWLAGCSGTWSAPSRAR